MKEECLPPGKWALGKIEQVHSGNDNLVRVASLKTQSGIFKRPINKLIKLPIDSEKVQPLPEKKTQISPKQKQSKRTRKPSNTLLNYLCMLLYIFSLIGSSVQQTENIKITPFEKGWQIYYDEIGDIHTVHDSWTLLTYINMTTYRTGIAEIETYINYVQYICKKFDYQSLCLTLVAELKHEFQEIEHNNYILRNPQEPIRRRTKREFFNGVGNLAHSLFGVLDENFAQKYQEDIKNVQNKEQYLLHLIKNQTTIIEAQNNILIRSEKVINKQFEYMKKHLDNDSQIT